MQGLKLSKKNVSKTISQKREWYFETKIFAVVNKTFSCARK